jgi:Haem-binding domain
VRRPIRWGLVVFVLVFVAIQFLPYGWQRYNPPITQDAPWPTESAEALARTSCYDCHSNETDWPVYAYVAPFSWFVISDVDNGREKLNFSEWDDDAGKADDAAEEIAEDSMPPSQYTLIHRDAQLSDDERQELIAALQEMDESR